MAASLDSISLAAAVDAALFVEKQRAERVFVVGGVVRDLVMQRAPGDFDLDIVVEGDAISFAHQVAQHLGGSVREHPAFLTAKIQGPFRGGADAGCSMLVGARQLTEIDIASSRTEIYPKPGALPVVSRAPIEKDLWRRDFSINAMAISLATVAPLWTVNTPQVPNLDSVLDPTGGRRDINQSTIRVLHKGSFVDDPSRLFRAVRYAERLHFHFDLESLAAFMEAVKSGALATLSPRRILNEVLVSFDEPAPARVIEEFFERGLFFHLPLISENNEEVIISALRRLESHRGVVSVPEFREAGRLIVLAGLLYDGREDVALATHEGGKSIAAARRVLLKERLSPTRERLSDALAQYCLHATVEARVLLEEILQGGAL